MCMPSADFKCSIPVAVVGEPLTAAAGVLANPKTLETGFAKRLNNLLAAGVLGCSLPILALLHHKISNTTERCLTTALYVSRYYGERCILVSSTVLLRPLVPCQLLNLCSLIPVDFKQSNRFLDCGADLRAHHQTITLQV